MDTMDILSTEVVTSLIIFSAISMSVRSITAFSKTLSKLRPKLKEIERRLDHIHAGMDSHQSKLAGLSESVSPLQQQESRLQSYYNEIRRLDLKSEREMVVSEQNKKDKKELEIRRKNLEGI